jgi:hypothetical protein
MESYNMDENCLEPFVSQLRKSFQNMKAETYKARIDYELKINALHKELETSDERYAFGKFDDESLYNKFRLKKQCEISQAKEILEGTDYEISNLDYYIL